jgi:hypothetical protein
MLAQPAVTLNLGQMGFSVAEFFNFVLPYHRRDYTAYLLSSDGKKRGSRDSKI